MMKKLILFIAILIAHHLSLLAQTTSPTVIASGGDFFTSPSAQISFTFGELAAIETFSSGGHILTQGFQQNELNGMGLNQWNIPVSVKCWPNPSNGNIQVSYHAEKNGKLDIDIYTSSGQNTGYHFDRNIHAGENTENLSLSNLRSGSYILQLRYSESNGNTYQTHFNIQIVNQY